MDYSTYPVTPELAPFIKCFWTLEAPMLQQPVRQRIVPDGCMEMIFHCGDLYRQYLPGGDSILQPDCFVFGQITSPLEVEPTGSTCIFSVRFHPDGFTPFLTLPLERMENRAVALSELFGEAGRELAAAVFSAAETGQRIRVVEEFFLQRIAVPETVDRVARAGVELILRLHGQLSVDEISGQINVNRRNLERKFASLIGLSPKQLSRMIRLQATLKLLAERKYTSLSSLAQEGEYYDQAHFIRDFKAFTGMSPSRFFTGSLQMSALFAAGNSAGSVG